MNCDKEKLLCSKVLHLVMSS